MKRLGQALQGWGRTLVRCLVMGVPGATGALATGVSAQITLDQDFDSGALDVAASTVDLSNPSQPVVTLEPRRITGAWSGDHWWVHFKASGVSGSTAGFQIPTAAAFQPYTNEHRWVWTTTPEDEASWSFFDTGMIAGAFFRSVNLTPFADDEIWVAYGLPYPYSRTCEHTAALIGNPLVFPTASADAAFVLGTTAGTVGGGYTDDLGDSVPALELFGYRIGDGSGRPKKKVVVTSGNHSGEPTGTWTMQGFVDFVLSDDPDALELRRLADVYVYPQSDPEGRHSGYFRSNPENPTLNHNRHWEDTTGFTDLTLLTAAMVADTTDTAGGVDYFLDFHAFGSATDLSYILPTSNPSTKVFIDALLALEPSLTDGSSPNPQPGETAARWAAWNEGLGATVTITPESGTLAGEGVERYLLLGENYARAVLAGIQDEPRVTRPGSAGVYRRRALARNPELYLQLDESSGTSAADASGNARHGAYVGSVGLGGSSAFVVQGRSSIKLDGAGGHVRVPDFPYATASGVFTLAFWFRTSAIDGTDDQFLFSHGEPVKQNSVNVFFQETPVVGTGNRLRTVVIDADDPEDLSNVLDVSIAPADGDWHFYTLVFSAQGAVLYLDGHEVKRRPGAGGDGFDPTGDLFLGVRQDLAAGTAYGRPTAQDGYLDEVLLFDAALDPDAVLGLARSPLKGYVRGEPTLVSLSSATQTGGPGDPAGEAPGDRLGWQVLDASGEPRDAWIRAGMRAPGRDSAVAPPPAAVLLFVPAEGLWLSVPPQLRAGIEWQVCGLLDALCSARRLWGSER